MEYYDPDNPKSRRAGAVAAALYVVVAAVLLGLVRFDFSRDELAAGNGLLLQFGEVARAAGREEPAPAVRAEAPASPATAPSATEAVVTAEDEEAPAVAPASRPEPRPSPETKPTPRPTPQPVTPAAPAREVNRRALFPGRAAGSSSGSEGEHTGAGNEGDPTGAPDGSHTGTGQGTSGEGFDLAGRRLIGMLPKPRYTADEAGKVVVRITVNAQGRVTGATFRSVGSTTQNAVLVDAALKAAREARFTPDEERDLQTGTITYIFKMD